MRSFNSMLSSRQALLTTFALLPWAITVHAGTISKADNMDDLTLGNSWGGGTAPGVADVAKWDFAVTGANASLLGAATSWGGIAVADPAGPVDITGAAVLTVGASGINAAGGTQNLTIANPVNFLGNVAQTWSSGPASSITVNGAVSRTDGVLGGPRALVNFDSTAGGSITLNAGTANAMLNYATFNKTDFAALDASKKVAAGISTATTGTYANNPATGTALPNLTGTFGVLDIVNYNTAGATAVRIGGSTNITLTNGIRFNTPAATGGVWSIDLANRNLNVGNTTMLVTPNVGPFDVQVNGAGNVRMGAGAEYMIQQHNTQGNLIYNGAMTQPAGNGSSITKAGAGLVILAGANAISGVTRILEGPLQVGNNGTAGVLPSGNVINNGALIIKRSDGFALTNAISGTGSLSQSGAGTLTVSGANTYTGATNVTSGVLAFTTGLGNFGNGTQISISGGSTVRWPAGVPADLSTRTVTIGTGGALLDIGANNVTFSAGIGNNGGGNLTKQGSGTLTLSGTNTYTGGTLVTAGKVVLAPASSLASGAVVVQNSATFGGTGTSGGTITVKTSGTLAPGQSVGTLTTAGLTLEAGAKLDFEFNATPTNDMVAVTSPGGLTLDGGGFNLYQEGGTTAFATPGTYRLLTYSGAIAGAGLGSLSVLNGEPGKNYVFTATDSEVYLNIAVAGVLSNWQVAAGGSWNTTSNWSSSVPNQSGATAKFSTILPSPQSVTLDGNKMVGGATFESLIGYTLTAGTGGTLTFDNGVNQASLGVNSGSHTISVPTVLNSNLVLNTVTGSSLAFPDAVSGTGRLTKAGAGTLLLGAANTYTGGTTIAEGILEFANPTGLGSGPVSIDAATLRWTTGNTADISASTITLSGKATFDTNGNDVTMANGIGNGGVGGVQKSGNGSLTLTGNNTYTGLTCLTAGALTLQGTNASSGLLLAGDGVLAFANSEAALGSAAGNIEFDPGAGKTATFVMEAPFNIANTHQVRLTSGIGSVNVMGSTNTIAAPLVGTGTLRKMGSGTLILTAVNNVNATGGAIVEEGTLQAGTAASLPAGSITMNGISNLSIQGAGAVRIAANGTHTITEMTNGQILGISGLSGAGNVTLVPSTTVIDITGAMNTFSGKVTLPNGNYRFNFNAVNQGSPLAAFDLGVLATNLNVRVNGGAVHLGSVSGGPATALEGAGGGNSAAIIWNIGGKNEDTLFEGTIRNGAGGAAVVKIGTGTQTLSGINVYLNGNTVTAGTLLINGDSSAATGPTSVASGAKFGGSGKIGGAVTVAAGGELVPGSAGVGSFQTGVTTLDGKLKIALDGAATPKATSLVVVGDLTLGAASTLSFNVPAAPITGNGIILASYTGTLTGTFGTTENLPSGYTVNYAYNDGLSSKNIALVSSVATPYSTWATANSLTGPDALGTADPDQDGLINLLEFALNNDPKSALNTGKMRVQIAQVGGQSRLTLTIPVRTGAIFAPATHQAATKDGLVYTVQGSTTTGTWDTLDVGVVTPALSSDMPALDAGWSYFTFDVTSPVSSQPRAFLRASVVEGN